MDFVFTPAKGKVAYYASLPATDDALVAVPLEASGLEPDGPLSGHADLAALLTVSSEQTTMGRQVLTDVAVATDPAGWNGATASDFTWPGATGNAISAIVICYDPDVTSSADADLIPLTKHDFDVIPSGGDIAVEIDATGFYRAT